MHTTRIYCGILFFSVVFSAAISAFSIEIDGSYEKVPVQEKYNLNVNHDYSHQNIDYSFYSKSYGDIRGKKFSCGYTIDNKIEGTPHEIFSFLDYVNDSINDISNRIGFGAGFGTYVYRSACRRVKISWAKVLREQRFLDSWRLKYTESTPGEKLKLSTILYCIQPVEEIESYTSLSLLFTDNIGVSVKYEARINDGRKDYLFMIGPKFKF